MNEAFGTLLGTFAIACECARPDCDAMLEVPGIAYRAIRHLPRMTVVLPAHFDSARMRVVRATRDYAVVEVVA